jgi:hypothetical protein
MFFGFSSRFAPLVGSARDEVARLARRGGVSHG